METGQPSRTARAAARHRAAHQILEGGRIFEDPLAIPILGEDAAELARRAEEDPSSQRMRIFIAARTRFAEDALTSAVNRGVKQLVVLGAGLDTYAYRGKLRDRLRIFEVDHPATQEWKRQRLKEASIAVPDSLTYAPIDFERESLQEGLATAGFDLRQPTFFTWLGVVPYLTEESIWTTLRFVAGLPNGGHIVFDYANPPESLRGETRIEHERRAARVADLGEPWVTYFETEHLHRKLKGAGFAEIEDMGPRQIASRYFPNRASSRGDEGGHVTHAATPYPPWSVSG